MAEETKERAKAATYFVLGKADDEDFAKAEHLAETLMSALPSGERPAPPPFPPAQPDSLPRVCSSAVTCHILPTLPGAWPALCKTTCARCVRPRCDAPAPNPSEMQASGAPGHRAGGG